MKALLFFLISSIALADISTQVPPVGQTTMSQSLPVTVASDQTTFPVSQSSPPWTFNLTEFGGNNVVTGTGGSGLGIPRFTIANDSNVLVTQSTSPWVSNISQFGGNNVVTGTGNSGVGIPRVTISNDSSLTNISGTISLPTNAAQETGGNLDDIDLNTDNLNLAQGSTTSGQHGPLVQGAVTTAAPSYSTAQTNPFSLSLAGGLRFDLTQVGDTNISTGIGAGGAGIPRVTVSNDSKILIWDSTNTNTVKAASTAPAATDTAIVVGLSPNGNQATEAVQTNGTQESQIVGTVKTNQPAATAGGSQVLQIMDPFGQMSVVREDSMAERWGTMFASSTTYVSAGASSETPFLYINNPNASGKSIRLNKMFLSGPHSGDTTYNCYIDPTITANGTALTIAGGRQTNQNATVATAFRLPTASANGTLFFTIDIPVGGSQVVYWNFTKWIEANHRLLCTVIQSLSGNSSGITMEWKEE